jgi:predicted small lipoprotein YifL
MTNRIRLMWLTLLLILAQGCGQMGPLYLPDEPEPQESNLTHG